MLITLAEACRELKIGKSTLYQYVEAGLVPVIKVGSKLLRFDKDELILWFKSGGFADAKKDKISPKNKKGGIR